MSSFGIKDCAPYVEIRDFYGDRRAERSGVPLIQHIDEGLELLDRLGATDNAKHAYCLHPLFQGDADLARNISRVSGFDQYLVALVFEYRNVANAYLSHRHLTRIDEIALSPLLEVNDMLRADKLQNFKDFITYHAQTHPRAQELMAYFSNWFKRLNIYDYAFSFIKNHGAYPAGLAPDVPVDQR